MGPAPIGPLALVGGNGDLPLLALQALIDRGLTPYRVAITPDGSFAQKADCVIPFVRAGAIMDHLRERGIQDAVILGGVTRPWRDLWAMDFFTTAFLAKNIGRLFRDDGLLKAMRATIEGQGIRLHAIQDLVPELMAPPGCLTVRAPSPEDEPLITAGWIAAKEWGQRDRGQAIVVQQGRILARENIWGTQSLIQRAGAKALKTGRGPILIKIAKPGQDRALDMPTIGPHTIEQCVAHGYGGLVIEAGSVFILHIKKTIELADKNKFFIFSKVG